MLKRRADLSTMFQALADPVRRSIVERLTRGPASVSELAKPFSMSLSGIARHIAVLEHSGLVTTEKVGRVRMCRLDAEALMAAEQWLIRRRTWEVRFAQLGQFLGHEEKQGNLSIGRRVIRRVVEKQLRKVSKVNTVISKDGTRIAYTATGKGPAIILVGGATSYPALDPTLPVLTDLIKDDFTFVLYDRRGRGESGDTKPFSVDREIEDIEALIDAVGGKAGLYGQSSGAVLSLQAAGKLSGVTHVLAYEPPYSMPGPGHQMPADYAATLERFNAAGDRSGAAAYFMKTVGAADADIEGMKQSPFWPVMEAVAPTIVYDAYAMTRDRKGAEIPSHLWAGSRAKILVVDGGASFPGMPEAADGVAKATPGARRKTLGAEGHGPSPESIAPVIKEFFAS